MGINEPKRPIASSPVSNPLKLFTSQTHLQVTNNSSQSDTQQLKSHILYPKIIL